MMPTWYEKIVLTIAVGLVSLPLAAALYLLVTTFLRGPSQ